MPGQIPYRAVLHHGSIDLDRHSPDSRRVSRQDGSSERFEQRATTLCAPALTGAALRELLPQGFHPSKRFARIVQHRGDVEDAARVVVNGKAVNSIEIPRPVFAQRGHCVSICLYPYP
jgi:hypothetical protein